MTAPDRGTRLVARAIVVLLPADLRREHGGDVARLIVDRRVHGGEPRWRLWPSVACDVAATAARTRWEEAMVPVRALVVGTVFGIGAFALLSRAVVPGLVLLALAAAIHLATRSRGGRLGVVRASWVPWAVGGVLAVGGAVGGLVLVQDRSPGAVLWISLLLVVIAGLASLGAAAVLAVDGRRPVASA